MSMRREPRKTNNDFTLLKKINRASYGLRKPYLYLRVL